MKLVKTLLAVGALCAFVNQASAISIDGQIKMSGETVLNGPLASATAFTSFSNVKVGPANSTGTYSGVTLGTAVTYTPFTFKPALVPSPVTPLWTFTDAGVTYSFELDTVTVMLQNNRFLNLFGTGTATATGYDATPGVWTFSIDTTSNPTGFNFNFISTTEATPPGVPDGGLTMALLGFALVGVEGLRRRFSK